MLDLSDMEKAIHADCGVSRRLFLAYGASLAAVPLLVKVAMERINRPESERGSRNRLRSIRDDSGFRSDSDAF